MFQEEDCSGTQEQPTAEQKIYKSVSKDKSIGCRPQESAIFSSQPSGGLDQISAETFTTMKIQDKDENKFSDEDGVVWDLTTWIIFYSLLPWFAGEILSSQVVEYSTPVKIFGKKMFFFPIRPHLIPQSRKNWYVYFTFCATSTISFPLKRFCVEKFVKSFVLWELDNGTPINSNFGAEV